MMMMMTGHHGLQEQLTPPHKHSSLTPDHHTPHQSKIWSHVPLIQGSATVTAVEETKPTTVCKNILTFIILKIDYNHSFDSFRILVVFEICCSYWM